MFILAINENLQWAGLLLGQEVYPESFSLFFFSYYRFNFLLVFAPSTRFLHTGVYKIALQCEKLSKLLIFFMFLET